MTDKKGYEPSDEQQPNEQPQQEPVESGPVAILTIVRKADGSLGVIDNMRECRSIDEALLIRSRVWFYCDQFIQFVQYAQAQEKAKLSGGGPSFIQGLRNGFGKNGFRKK